MQPSAVCRSTAACQGSVHLAIGTPGKLSLYKFLPSASAPDASSSPSQVPDQTLQQETDSSVHRSSHTAAQANVSAAGSSSPAHQPHSQCQQEDAAAADNSFAPPAGHAPAEAQPSTADAWRMVAHEAHSLPGTPTQLAVSWSMPPEFFQQVWKVCETSPCDPSPHTGASHMPSSASADKQIPRSHTADAASVDEADASTMLGRLQINGGRQMGLPELPSLRKGAAQGIVPRVNLIAQSYAWLHVALATGSSDRSLAGMQPHVPGERLSVTLHAAATHGIGTLASTHAGGSLSHQVQLHQYNSFAGQQG